MRIEYTDVTPSCWLANDRAVISDNLQQAAQSFLIDFPVCHIAAVP